MTERMKLDFTRDRNALRAMLQLGAAVRASGLEKSLVFLVEVRASQINGCGFCIDMHTKDARAAGESEQRLYLLSAWREASTTIYTLRERAALAWTEAVTRLDPQHVSNDVYEAARAQFNEHELMALTLAIVAINGWNRINIAFQTPAGEYQPGSLATLTKEFSHA
jgi:AhpD family alkylhydroperoxidase